MRRSATAATDLNLIGVAGVVLVFTVVTETTAVSELRRFVVCSDHNKTSLCCASTKDVHTFFWNFLQLKNCDYPTLRY